MHPFLVTCTVILAISISSINGQDQGGGSTQVTGLRLRRETMERDLKDLNAAINAQAPGRGRKRRQLFGLKPSLPNLGSAPSLNLNSITPSLTNPVQNLTNSVSKPVTGLLNGQNPVKIQAQNPTTTTTTTTPKTTTTTISSSSSTSSFNTSSEETQTEIVPENAGSTENPRNPVNSGNTGSTTTENPGSISSMFSSVTNLLNKAVVKPVSSLTKTTYVLLTDVQRKFVAINQNFFSALKFYNSEKIQNNPVLKETVIVKQEGVECRDVCDPEGPGFGLLGLCTPNFCSCFETKGNETELSLKEKRCRDDQVFDPHPAELSCRNPADTVLCADPK